MIIKCFYLGGRNFGGSSLYFVLEDSLTAVAAPVARSVIQNELYCKSNYFLADRAYLKLLELVLRKFPPGPK